MRYQLIKTVYGISYKLYKIYNCLALFVKLLLPTYPMMQHSND